ncbi:TetR family transcriptional regulator [Polymorphospora sp. NPDC050346]|uniref:TetR/AcrR family transcriptional regulator n=1 Tax=Polymorphospora sp. NPDC050346 TaxID=3155780 RepID=UPI0033FB1A98
MSRESSAVRRDGRVTDTRERVRAVALRLFVTKGFSATSLKDIADALGVTKAALYYHFPAKADLARSIFQPFIDDVDALLTRLDRADRPPREILTAYVETLIPHREAFAAIMRDPTAAADLDVEGASQRWLDRLTELLATGDTPEVRIRVTVAVGGLTRVLVLPDADADAIRGTAIDAAVAALGPAAHR